MIQRLLLFAFLVITNTAFSQNKMNLALHQAMQEDAAENRLIHVLVQGDPTEIRHWSELGNAQFCRSAGDIVWLKIEVRHLAALNSLPKVRRIEAFPQHTIPMNDTMRMLCRVDEVHAGLSPLNTTLKGRGVLMGYIDSGLDLHHPDFLDSLGNTRVAFLWDMTLPDSVNTPQPYGYGQEFTASDIMSGAASAHTGEQEYGHGTYVTGIGSGNGRAVGHFQGVAPESELIIVDYDFTANDTVPRYAHAVDYIFQKASQLGKPCVINASLGDYYGSHDGRDLQSLFISNLLNAQPGRVLVAAAGNVGVVYPFHIGNTTIVGDTSFTWFKYNTGYGGAYMQVFGDSADIVNMRFSIGADKVTPYFDFRGNITWRSVATAVNAGLINASLTKNGNRIGQLQIAGTDLGGVYSLEVFVVPDSIDYNWRFMVAGNGHYDGWNFDWVFQNLPSVSTYPPMADYVSPDTLQSIVSGFACLDNVITVGNYFNTDRHVDVTGTLQISPNDLPRQLASNSSRGPTRDGRVKPDICAPGHHILSTGVLTLLPGLIAGYPYKVAEGGFHVTGGGTSASAPVVAGVAALYLQQHPGADWQAVESAIYNCAAQDQFTWGPYPNNAWGYGKVDAFGVLTTCSSTGIMSVDVLNDITLFPNPANSELHLSIGKSVDQFLRQIELLQPDGRLIKTWSISGNLITLDISDLAAGTYFLRMEHESDQFSMKSFTVTH